MEDAKRRSYPCVNEKYAFEKIHRPFSRIRYERWNEVETFVLANVLG